MTGVICIITLVLWVLGFFSNLFIVVCNALQVRLERSLQTIDILLASFSLGNLLTGLFNIAVILLLSLNLCPHAALIFLWELTSGIQKWAISLISLFFYLRVVPGQRDTFLWLKNHFGFLVMTIMLVGCACTLTTITIDLFFEEHHSENMEHQVNCSYTKLPPSLSALKLFLKTFTYIGVFILMVFSCGALMAHLIVHMKKMRENNQLNQNRVARATIMIFFLAFEFVVCAIARYTVAGIFQLSLTEVSINNYCLVNLTLVTIIPMTLIVGINALRDRAVSLCFNTSGNKI